MSVPSSSSSSGSLWLVDATGAYPVRAQALGGGVLWRKQEEESDERQVLAATVVADALARRWNDLSSVDGGSPPSSLPYFDMSIDSAISEVLSILRQEEVIDDDTILELVSVEYPSERIRRR